MQLNVLRHKVRLQLFELFNNTSSYKFQEGLGGGRNKNVYYFTTETGWQYEVSFIKPDHAMDDDRIVQPNFYFLAFKAKQPSDYFYDFDVMTGENNVSKIMNTITEIIKEHQKKHNVEKYGFTTNQKRLSLYKIIASKIPGWSIERDEKNNRFFLKKD